VSVWETSVLRAESVRALRGMGRDKG
jgi:hypothetical protein